MPIPGTEPGTPKPVRTDHPPRPQHQRDEVRYVFAVGRAHGGPEPGAMEGDSGASAAGLCGPSGAPIRTVDGAGLSALVSDVPAGLYDESGLKAQLEDLERLEALARCHHSVVAAAYEHGTVLPMRLATVYLDDSRVRAMLEQRRDEFDDLLSRLEGHVEWGVKVYADPREAAVGTAQPPSVPRPSGPSHGRSSDQRAEDSGGGSSAARTATPTVPPVPWPNV
jgi:hypothetical protein